MDKLQIITEIENKVGSYTTRTIGITADPQRRKGEHNNPPSWKDWQANNESDARDIEKYFLDKGMRGDSGGGYTPNWVYIF